MSTASYRKSPLTWQLHRPPISTGDTKANLPLIAKASDWLLSFFFASGLWLIGASPGPRHHLHLHQTPTQNHSLDSTKRRHRPPRWVLHPDRDLLQESKFQLLQQCFFKSEGTHAILGRILTLISLSIPASALLSCCCSILNLQYLSILLCEPLVRY